MTYDGEFLDVDELKTSAVALHYVLVDLQGTKSTTRILQGLQDGFPVAETEIQKGVHELLGATNKRIADKACALLSMGDAEGLGQLMYEAQAAFDKYAQPACPSELTMPLLHKVMDHEPLRPLVHGIKGVGSQGDGTGQLLCKSKKDQAEVQRILQDDFSMPSITLTLQSGPEVKIAVIPAAGFGQNNFPASVPVRSELFPIIIGGVAQPIVYYNVASLVEAGIEKVYIIVQGSDLAQFEKLFKTPVSSADFAKLSDANQQWSKQILRVGEKVEFIVQDQQEGFGHAVYTAKKHVGEQPFLLMIGDHIYHSKAEDGRSCPRQMLDTFKLHQKSVIGLKTTPIANVSRFGAASGVLQRNEPNDDGTGTDVQASQLLDVKQMLEKPSVEEARAKLKVNGLEDEEVLTMFGLYIISPKVFDYLEENISNNVRSGGAFQFTPALNRLREEEGLLGLIIEGQRYDIGSPDSYLNTLIAFNNADHPSRPTTPLI